MKKILFLCVLSFFGIYKTAQAKETLCIQNFNAYGPIYARSVSARSQVVVEELRKEQCDIIQLQEVWNDSTIDIYERGLKSHYQIATPNRKSRIGVMTAHRLDAKEEWTYSFRVNSDQGIFDRVRSVANVKKAFHIIETQIDDERFYLVNTHLHPSSSAVRVTQVVDLYSWYKLAKPGVIILSGDFNADPASVELRLLKHLLQLEDLGEKYYGGRYPAHYCTYCAENPLGWLSEDKIFDYIFASKSFANSQWRISNFTQNLKTKNEMYLSDHYGIKVELTKDNQPLYQFTSEIFNNPKEIYQEAQKTLTQSRLKNVNDYIRFFHKKQQASVELN
ncbi:MAG: endonuclease/exonuclease/phosphatase family protein [Bdellovibrionia bacterium]